MSRPFTVTESIQASRTDATPRHAELARPERPDDAVDSTAVRWVFVATVAFWVLVVEAGRLLF